MHPERSPMEEKQEFKKVVGFTQAADLQMTLANISDYEKSGMLAPKPGEYNQDNGIIAAATSSGDIIVWVPKEDPTAPRTVSFEEAIQSLEENGYTHGNFGVPKF